MLQLATPVDVGSLSLYDQTRQATNQSASNLWTLVDIPPMTLQVILPYNPGRSAFAHFFWSGNNPFLSNQPIGASPNAGFTMPTLAAPVIYQQEYWGSFVSGPIFAYNSNAVQHSIFSLIDISYSPSPVTTQSPSTGLQRLQQAGLIPGALTSQQQCALSAQIEAIIRELKSIYIPSPDDIKRALNK